MCSLAGCLLIVGVWSTTLFAQQAPPALMTDGLAQRLTSEQRQLVSGFLSARDDHENPFLPVIRQKALRFEQRRVRRGVVLVDLLYEVLPQRTYIWVDRQPGTVFEPNNECEGVRLLFYPNRGALAADTATFEVRLTDRCTIATLTTYHSDGRGRREATLYRPDGSIEEQLVQCKVGSMYHDLALDIYAGQEKHQLRIFFNQEVQPLSEIYASCSADRKAYLRSTVRRHDRIPIGVIDTGIAYNHPELAYKVLRVADCEQSDLFLSRTLSGWDYADDDFMPFDFSPRSISVNRHYGGHGTMMASICAQGSDDLALVPLRVYLGYDGEGIPRLVNRPFKKPNYFEIIRHAHDQGVRLFNLSFFTDDIRVVEGLRKAMETFDDSLFVSSAGNAIKGQSNNIEEYALYPALFVLPNHISVANFDPRTRSVAASSRYSGKHVQVAAVGEQIAAYAPTLATPIQISGTSPAAANVTNLIGLVMATMQRRLAFEVTDMNSAIVALIRGLVLANARPEPALRGRVVSGAVVDAGATLKAAAAVHSLPLND